MFLPNKKDAKHKAWLYRVLRGLYDDTFLADRLYFKGGTCAAMRNFLDRFSIDLDFDYVGQRDDFKEVQKKMEIVFNKLGLKSERDCFQSPDSRHFSQISPATCFVSPLMRHIEGTSSTASRLKFEKNHQKRELKTVPKDQSQKIPQYFLRYPAEKNQRNTLKIDVSFPPPKANKYEAARLEEIDRIIYCQTAETMFANKLVALIERYERTKSIAGRDLYDIHYFFINNYDYDPEIIMERRQQKDVEFLKNLQKFIEKKVTQKIIDQDINTLVTPDKFKKIRKILKPEVLMFINDEINSKKGIINHKA